MTSRRPTLWTRDYTLTLVVGFCLSMVFYLLMTTMALYAVAEFGAGETLAGLTASIYVVGALAACLGAGVAVDALGRRRILLIALTAFTVIGAAYLLADGLAVLLVLRCLHGLAFGTAHTAAASITQSLIPTERRAEGTGYLGASTTLATAIGPFLAVLLVNVGSYDGIFLASAVAAFLGLAAGLGLRAPAEVPRTAGAAGGAAPARRAGPLEARALPIATVVLVGAVAYSGVVAFVNSYAVSLDLTAVAAVFFVVYAVVVLGSRAFVGRLQDTRGDNVVIYPAIILLVAGFAVLAVTRNAALLLTAAALLGAGWGTLMSAGQAVAVSKAPIANVGKTLSTYFLFVDLGMGLGPVVLGALLARTDFRVMYLTLAVLVLLSTGLYYAVHSRHTTSARPPITPEPRNAHAATRRP